MITRVWEGETKTEHSEVYSKIIKERDIPDYRKTKGFVKLTFLKRNHNNSTYFKLITFWEDFESIKNFTGPDLEKAVYYTKDKNYLIDFPGSILHYQVFAE